MYRKGNLRYASCRRLELVNKIHNLQTSIQCRELTLRRRCAPRLLFSSSSGPVISLQTPGARLRLVRGPRDLHELLLGPWLRLPSWERSRPACSAFWAWPSAWSRSWDWPSPWGFRARGASSSWPWCFLLDRRRLIDAADLGRFLGVLEPLPSRATMPS